MLKNRYLLTFWKFEKQVHDSNNYKFKIDYLAALLHSKSISDQSSCFSASVWDSTFSRSLFRISSRMASQDFRRKIVDFAAFFFVNTFGFRYTTIHPKPPLFNPLATQQLHRIRNLSAVRWITYHFTTHKKSTYFEHIAKTLGFLNKDMTGQSPVAILS